MALRAVTWPAMGLGVQVLGVEVGAFVGVLVLVPSACGGAVVPVVADCDTLPCLSSWRIFGFSNPSEKDSYL